MEHRNRVHLLIGLLVLVAGAPAAQARVFMTQQQALAGAFPAGTKVARQVVFLTPQQRDAARKASGVDFADQMIVRYVGTGPAGTAGFAYFDTHRVRTLPETVMVVLTPQGTVAKVEILSFDEPPEYLPKPRWIDQLRGHALSDELSLRRSIRPITGASLSGRAIVNASRKVLAIHEVMGAK